jgi:hypothetical protein
MAEAPDDHTDVEQASAPPTTPPPAAAPAPEMRVGPTLAGTGPGNEGIRYQMMTPTAPLAPGAAMRVYPIPPGTLERHAEAPAQWAVDPSGRHQWRWWTGALWSHHVADDGQTTTDPLS